MIEFGCVRIATAYGVLVSEGGIASERPDVQEAWVICWPDADLVIPWPHGMTLKEAVRDWIATRNTGE